jgi:ankyrin repeat protein
MPSVTNSGDRFSWKFMQGLPLNKRELLISLSLSQLILTFPLFSWIACFWRPITKAMVADKMITEPHFFLFAVDYFLIVVLFGTANIGAVIEFPRKEFRSRNKKNIYLQILSGFLFLILVLLYFVVAAYILADYGIDIFTALERGIEIIFNYLISWKIVPILLLFIALLYSSIIKTWRNEEKSYRSLKINPYKEYVFIVVSAVLIAIPVLTFDFKTPTMFRGSELIRAVYEKNYNFIEREAGKKENINISNRFGFTPMLTAIHEGDLKMVKLLEKLGASYDGELKIIKNGNHNGFNASMLSVDSHSVEMAEYISSKGFSLVSFNKSAGFTPLHLASHQCKSKMVDYLLKQGADINALNDKGETPLLVAVRSNCITATVALKEAGASFDIKDSKGKSPLDYFSEGRNPEFKYYIEKYSRAPAGK